MSEADGRVVSTSGQLEETVERMLGAEAIAVDTEFHGEHRYWPELFLVQLADERGPLVVDPLAVGDLSPLGRLMEAESPVKVLHSARNDIAILARELGVRFSSVFDTQLAAAFLGHGEQTGLTALLRSVCGIRKHKGYTLSDWSVRPLSDEQLEYALDDVRHLLEIYRKQRDELTSGGRLEWYRSEAEELVDPETYGVPLERLLRKARSAGKVKRSRLPLLWELVRWRERVARELDKPRNYIVKDYVLAGMATMTPRDVSALSRLRGVSRGFLERWGEDVVQLVARVSENPPEDVPELRRTSNRPGVSARRDLLRIFLKQESRRLKIAPSILLPKSIMEAMATEPPASAEELFSMPGMTGWRSSALGDDLVALLGGRLGLCMGRGRNGGLRFVEVRGPRERR